MAGNKNHKKLNFQTQANIFKALGNTSRMSIVHALKNKECSVSELQKVVGSDISTVSRHIAVLRNAGIVYSRKENLNVLCNLEKNIADLLTLIREEVNK